MLPKKLWILLVIGCLLFIYIQAGVPLLEEMVRTQGVLVAFPVFILIYALFAFFFGGFVGRSGKALVVFVAGFIGGDVIVPPILVSAAGDIPVLANQQLASDVFFFSIFRSWGISNLIAYYLTYIGIPLLMFAILALELRYSTFSRYLPKVMF